MIDKPKMTSRGLGLFKFKDTYESECSLQDSSSLSPRVWLGVDVLTPKFLSPEGSGWVPFEIPDGVIVNNRMHLDRDQARELARRLNNFANNGYLS